MNRCLRCVIGRLGGGEIPADRESPRYQKRYSKKRSSRFFVWLSAVNGRFRNSTNGVIASMRRASSPNNSGDVASFGSIHTIAGEIVLAAVAVRLTLAALAPAGGDLALRRPRRRGWLAATAAVMLTAALAAAVSGLWAESGEGAARLHAGLSDLALAAAGGHMSLMLLLFAA